MISSCHSSVDWYAVRVKSNRERVSALGLTGKGYEVFLPEHSRVNAAGKKTERAPLFPGYLFCRFDVTKRLPILTLPGVIHIVSLGKTPAPVDAVELESLKLLLHAGLPINPDEVYTVGEAVRVEDGPLAGVTGVITGQKSERLLVSITLLQRSVSVVLPGEWIYKLTQTAHDGSPACITNMPRTQIQNGMEARAPEMRSL